MRETRDQTRGAAGGTAEIDSTLSLFGELTHCEYIIIMFYVSSVFPYMLIIVYKLKGNETNVLYTDNILYHKMTGWLLYKRKITKLLIHDRKRCS